MVNELNIHLARIASLLALVLLTFIILQVGVPKASAQSANSISGYAWSDNIGGISLGGANYGLSVASDGSGTISGYAWSDNIGWVSANESGCPSGTCTPRLQNGVLTGWLKALAGGTVGSGGWDGWVSLSGSGYGVTQSGNNFSGYAWGSDIVGWTDFSFATVQLQACYPNANPSGYNSACTSAANACGQTNSGTISCSGSCSASAPSDASCSCAAPLTQTAQVACDANAAGASAISGSVTRSQTKSSYPACTFGTPVTPSNSTYVSDTCVYPTGTWTAPVCPSACGTAASTPAYTCTGGNLACATNSPATLSCPATAACGCTPPLTQNVTVACDADQYGVAATSGSVTRSQAKSDYPACTFPTPPVTPANSTYVSDTCVYPPPACSNGASNYPTCSRCPDGLAYVNGSCVVCSNGGCTSNPPGGGGGSSGNPTGGLICNNGGPNPPSCYASCTLPWGGTITNGVSVQAFPVPSVASPAACPASETRTCTNGSLSGSYTNSNCTVVYPSATISANPTRVQTGGSSNISWTTTDVNSCSITRNGSSWRSGLTGANLNSSALASNIISQSSFTITCQAVGGASVTSSVVVNVQAVFQEF
jgi:hypothetical protein